MFDVSQEKVNGKSESDCVYEQIALQFIDPASDDWRVCRGSAAEIAGNATWFSKILGDKPFADYYGTTMSDAAGSVCAGPCQTAVNPTAQVSISVSRGGGISIKGAVIGDNTLRVDDVIIVTAVETNRLFMGWRINGVMEPSANMEYSYTVTGLEEAPLAIEAVYSDAWYVDADNGSDLENDGCTPDTPKKTLAAILSVPGLMSGDVVHAAQGVYSLGTMAPSDNGSVHFRACVPEGVTLMADDGPEKTFIMGANATADVADEYGLGSNAVRCVMLNSHAKISGFTLTGGRTHKTEQDETDGDTASAVFGVSEVTSIAENCIITGNVAYSASCTACLVVNSLICDNHATFRRSVGFNIGLKGCIIDRNTGYYPLEYFFGVENCTIGPDNSRPILYYRRTPNVASPKVINTLVLASKSDSVMADVAASNSIFIEGCGINLDLLTGCIVTNVNALKIDADYAPVIGENVAVDAGNFELYDSDVCGDTDTYGRQRVANGRMDVGGVEASWFKRYSHDLGGIGISVTNASSAVVETDDGHISIPEGRLDLVWRNSDGRVTKHVVPVNVTGNGVLSVLLNGETLGTVGGTSGDTVMEFRSNNVTNRLSFIYVPGENDNGAAIIGEMKRLTGYIVVIR